MSTKKLEVKSAGTIPPEKMSMVETNIDLAEPGVNAARMPMGAGLFLALNNVMRAVGYVQKGGTNTFHNYKYATEADTIAALRPEMVKHGLILIPNSISGFQTDAQGNTHFIVHYLLVHAPTGESMDVTIPASGNDRSSKGAIGDKGTYKAMTGALKYALRQTFLLETGDDPEVANEVDKDATDRQGKADEAVLAAAASLMKEIDAIADAQSLHDLWHARALALGMIDQNNRPLYKQVRDRFKSKHEQISAMSTTTKEGES